MSDFLSAGRLEDHPFAVLSGLIFQESLTGELNLASGGRRRSVWFMGGNPVAVVSHDPLDHLAQFLLEHGKISEEDAHRLADLPETREGLGSADFIPKDTLNWGVKSRFVNICYDLFRWDEGEYDFQAAEPPRDLFLLKVPAHSLILKGVGLLGQTAVFDAVPDDAVCAPGPIAAADARYLGAEALELLKQCRPGRTVAEALAQGGADPDQARRLLYALTCLGLVALSHGPAAAPAAAALELEEMPGYILDEDAPAEDLPLESHREEHVELPAHDEPRQPEPAAAHGGPEFTLDLPPLNAEQLAAPGPGAKFESPDTLQQRGSYDFDEPAGSGSFGSFGSFDADSLPDTLDDTMSPEEEKGPAKPLPKRPGRFHVPRIAGIALGSVAALGVLAFAGWWWMSASEPPPPAVKPPIKRPVPAPLPVPVPAAPTAAAPVPAAPAAPAPPAPAPAPAPAAPAPVATAPAPPAAPAPAAPAAPAPVAGKPAPHPPAAAPAARGADRYRNALEIFRAGDFDGAAAIWEALLAEEHRGAFTVQILTACQHGTIAEAQRALGGHELYLVSKRMDGRVCYRVCVDTFDSREAAGRALAGLPPGLRGGGAAVRPIADILTRDR